VNKFADVMNLANLAEAIKDIVSIEELEAFKKEISGKLNSDLAKKSTAPIYQKHLATLKSSFEEVSGDNVL
jgi:hypothetical protein